MSDDERTRGRQSVWGVATAVLLTLLAWPAGASAEEPLLSTRIAGGGAVDRPCTDGLAARAHRERFTAPALGELTARLSGGSGDWDLAVFGAGSGKAVAGSAYPGSEEVAGGFAFAGEELIVQACRRPGASGSPTLDVGLDPIERENAGPAPAMVRVQTADLAAREALGSSGLDVTHSIGPDYTDVVSYGPEDLRRLDALGLGYASRIDDLDRRSAADRTAERRDLRLAGRADPATAKGFPSGRTGTYRRLFDYSEEMKALVEKYPKLVRTFTLPYETYEGRKVQGIEISRHVRAERDGKPIFMQLGVHHAREWPAGEHSLEWAYELLEGMSAGERRATRLVEKTRTIIVPIVNPDGFNASREAGELQGAAGGRGGDETQETVNIVTHFNEYRRKNCRLLGDSPAGSCAQPSAGLMEPGVDPNRNYGGFWGGPGASTMQTAADYRGPGPFSEPETQNIRSLFSRRQVTAFVTNHTFTGLVLRPPGIASQGQPVDEEVLNRLGEQMAAENGYVNQPAYELYDTTGSTEDWAYYATGALGYTFEIGRTNFHPPFADTVAEWNGTSELAPDAGGGNREAYYALAGFAANKRSHSLIKGRAPRRGLLTIRKSFETPTSPVLDANGTPGEVLRFRDELSATLKVRRNGRFRFNLNPSTRPLVAQARGRAAAGPPSDPLSFAGSPLEATPCANADGEDPSCINDHPFTVPDEPDRDNASAVVRIEWTTQASDWDLKLFRDTNGDGSSAGETNPVGVSAAGPSTSEQATITGKDLVAGGKYVARVISFVGIEPYEGTVSFQGPEPEVKTQRERWTLICTNRKGKRTGSRKLYIERGQTKRLDLRKGC